ncbi:hypothetical protein E8E11_010065 [Didymella keratinophila]|nr:hypothetical protein E8E11_010065 [Didymella keratinophila]
MRTSDIALPRERAAADPVSTPTATLDGATEQAKAPILLDKRFTYTTLDGSIATVSTCTQVYSFVFAPSHFARVEYPVNWPAGLPWPARTISELCSTPGFADSTCVGSTCYTATRCIAPECGHSFAVWARTTQDWQQHFELRETKDKGIGVFTKRAFKRGQVLGWYAGSLTMHMDSTYGYGLDVAVDAMQQTSEAVDMYNAWKDGRRVTPPGTRLAMVSYIKSI